MKRNNVILLLTLGIFLLMVSTPSLVCSEEKAKQSKEAVVDLQRVDELKGIQAAHEEAILNVPGVVGIGIGLAEDGKGMVFVVYCERLTPEALTLVPKHLEGVPVRLTESGVFKAN